jgi:hypothetical protein
MNVKEGCQLAKLSLKPTISGWNSGDFILQRPLSLSESVRGYSTRMKDRISKATGICKKCELCKPELYHAENNSILIVVPTIK